MTIFTEEGKQFLFHACYNEADRTEHEFVYVDIDGSFDIPMPEQYIDMENHIVCDECRQLLNEPTYGDVWECDECGNKMEAMSDD